MADALEPWEVAKAEANALFREKHYAAAVEGYTRSLALLGGEGPGETAGGMPGVDRPDDDSDDSVFPSEDGTGDDASGDASAGSTVPASPGSSAGAGAGADADGATPGGRPVRKIDPRRAPLLGNRAFAWIKLEAYGAAVADADASAAADPTYAKAHYRRADAHFHQLKFKEAVKDFRAAARVAPGDPDLRRKLVECEKAVKRIAFEAALRGPDDGAAALRKAEEAILRQDAEGNGPAQDVRPRPDWVPLQPGEPGPGDAGCVGATGAPVPSGAPAGRWVFTHAFCVELAAHLKAQKRLHPRFAYELLFQADRTLRDLPSLVDVPVGTDPAAGGAAGNPAQQITVCGDVHGQFYDLLHVFERNGWPSASNPYLFNGDFVDRGSFSVEVIVLLLAFRVADPRSMYLARGNHETRAMNRLYGFEGEVRAKYDARMVECYAELFCSLPIAHVLGRTVFVCHGGLADRDGVTLADLRAVDRKREPPEGGLLCDTLWSDPHDGDGRQPSKRGTGCQFGRDVTKRFLEENKLSLVVRSHEVKEEGFEVTHDGYCVTVFSAPNYCDQLGNKGAWVVFKSEDGMAPHFSQFEAQPHPPVRAMQFANPMLSLMG